MASEPRKRGFEKKADWVERFALALFGSLVLGKVVQGISLTQPSVLIGVAATICAYLYATYLLDKSI